MATLRLARSKCTSRNASTSRLAVATVVGNHGIVAIAAVAAALNPLSVPRMFSVEVTTRARYGASSRRSLAARLSALSVIVYGGPIRVSALARAEQVRTPTMTPIVAALEREGLVAREADASDGRASLLRATPRGNRVMQDGRGRRVARLAQELSRLPARDRQTLDEAVAILERVFGPPS